MIIKDLTPYVLSDAASMLLALKGQLDGPLRWPEDVTYEEMNLKGPGSLQRILLRAAHEIGDAPPSRASNEKLHNNGIQPAGFARG